MDIQLLRTREEIRGLSQALRTIGERIAFVPTMGYLHEGHLSLVEMANNRADKTIVSLFVNPKQFGSEHDLSSYPREEARDIERLQEHGVCAVFAPSVEEIYPEGHATTVHLSDITAWYEGAGRPGHFEGVTTVLSILFHLVNPHMAVFGEKDFQQLRVVEQMVEDLGFDVEILRAPLVRESDGLAMSSRNVRLSSTGRKSALALSAALREACARYAAGERKGSVLLEAAHEMLSAEEVKLEYLELVDEGSLAALQEVREEPARILIAACIEGVRLLDNMPLPVEGAS